LAEFQKKVATFLDASNAWLNVEKIETQAQAEQLNDQITGLRGMFNKVEAARKAAKRPHDDAGAAVQKAFTPLTTKLAKAGTDLKKKLQVYIDAEAKAAEQRKVEERAEAARLQAEADERARIAAEKNDIGAQVDAEEAAKAAGAAVKEAAKEVKVQVGSASGAGRTTAARTQRHVEVLNINVLFMHYRERPEVLEVLKTLATRDVRAKGFDPEVTKIPGINVITRKVV